jgi:hypothetical protein
MKIIEKVELSAIVMMLPRYDILQLFMPDDNHLQQIEVEVYLK